MFSFGDLSDFERLSYGGIDNFEKGKLAKVEVVAAFAIEVRFHKTRLVGLVLAILF